MRVTATALPGLGEIRPGSDLAAEIVAAANGFGVELSSDLIVVVASKVVAKAEGRTVPEAERDRAITAESTHVVAARSLPDGRVTRVVHTRQGPVLAAAGVDASDVAVGTVLLLPADPDTSARRLRAGIERLTGHRPAVVVTDTSGRPWRAGVTDFCLGAAGLLTLDDRRGQPDAAGRVLSVTVRNVADELAALGDLVKGKSAGTPVALVTGLRRFVTHDDGPGAAGLTRTGPTDWFQHGHVEAVWASLLRDEPAGVGAPAIDPAAETVMDRLGRAVALALACPAGREVAADVHPAGVNLTGPERALGGVSERLLSAAWAERLTLREDVETSPGTAIFTLANE